MRKQLLIAAGAIATILVMVAPAIAQVPGVFPGVGGFGPGCGAGVPFGGFGPGPVGCGLGAPLGGFGLGGCGFGLPFGDPFGSIVGLGIAMIDTVLSAAFSTIGFGLGGCGFPFGGCF